MATWSRRTLNSSSVAEEVAHMKRGITLQEATEVGPRSPWNDDSECVVDMVHFAAPGKSMC